MYPTSEYPSYGIFVKRFVEQVNSSGTFCIQSRSLIKGRVFNPFMKLWKYTEFYFSIFLNYFKYNDLVYVHQVSHSALPLYVLSLFKKRKLVLNFHGDDAFVNSYFEKLVSFFVRVLVLRSTLIIVPSNFLKRIVQERFSICESKIFISESSGVDVNKFSALFPKSIRDKELVLGYFGRFDERKGIPCLIAALSHIQGVSKFFFIGDGEYLAHLKRYVADNSLSFECLFIPTVKQEELVSYFQKIDIFIYPTERESLGLIGLEAMACGVPIIGSDIDGVSDYLINGFNGLVFPVNDSDSLVKQIDNYKKLSIQGKQKMSESARCTAVEYSSSNVLQKLIRRLLYEFKNEP